MHLGLAPGVGLSDQESSEMTMDAMITIAW